MVCFTSAAWGPQRASRCVIHTCVWSAALLPTLEPGQELGKGQKGPLSNQNRWHHVRENSSDLLWEHNYSYFRQQS